MSENYTGVKVITARPEIINALWEKGKVDIFDNRYAWHENMFVVVKDEAGEYESALCRVKGPQIHLLPPKRQLGAQGVHPRNKEQEMTMSALLDDDIKVVVLTGKAGVGKTLLGLAAAIEKVQEGKYEKILLSRPMSNVGRYNLGMLPGTVDEKVLPYMGNFMDNLVYLVGKKAVEDLITQAKIEFVPLALIRGHSWMNAYVIFDECQTLDNHEVLTIGTRVAEGTKLVICGDLNQRDERIAKDKTGMYKFVNHDLSKSSSFVSSIELQKSERGPVSALFADVFEV